MRWRREREERDKGRRLLVSLQLIERRERSGRKGGVMKLEVGIGNATVRLSYCV